MIGIDLGTTNCTLSYVLKESDEVQQFKIPQTNSSQTLDAAFSFPSFLYFPLAEELEAKVASLPWNQEAKFVTGEFAKHRGAEIPSRLIASSKSWLCHSDVDRRQKMLPINGEELVEKMSPLEVTKEFLVHLKNAWNLKMQEMPFEQQKILITVPASFDPSAIELVQEAAKWAGYPEILLLEEPQAAFYAWIYDQRELWRKCLTVGDLVLVVDIGGGTTDFSLIGVEEQKGHLLLKRESVGSHLLLGGDNIDLALAYFVRQKLEDQNVTIDTHQFHQLVHQCRSAKEQLLSKEAPEEVELVLLGKGRRLIGNSIKTLLTKKEVDQIVLEGFFPLVDSTESSLPERRSGLQQIGLPFVQDPRVSCQLARFLSINGTFVLPTAVLFNGGTMKSPAIRERLLQLLNRWAETKKAPSVKELTGVDYDYAVSRGAAYYGLVREGKGLRIKSGTSRSYFIGVEESAPAVPGFSPPLKALCIVPFGLEEGEERELSQQEFSLLLGELASFRFFSHPSSVLENGEKIEVGTVVKDWKKYLTELHPLEVLLERKEGEGKTVRVKLKSKVTETGVLELWCMGPEERKWKLEFSIRH